MAPFVVKDRVIVGASGGEFGIYGWVKGSISRPARSSGPGATSVPDAEMLIKAGTFKPFYDKGTDLGQDDLARLTAYKIGGAPVWGWMSYDPELDLVYYGVGNPSPYNSEQRAGDNKWTASVLARHPGDGSLVWAYQFTPHDNWDLRRRLHHDPGGPQDRRSSAEGTGHLQQERLPVHARPRDR